MFSGGAVVDTFKTKSLITRRTCQIMASQMSELCKNGRTKLGWRKKLAAVSQKMNNLFTPVTYNES